MQAQIDLVGTVFGVVPPNVPLPANITLANDGFVCRKPTGQGKNETRVFCTKDPKFKTNITTDEKFYPGRMVTVQCLTPREQLRVQESRERYQTKALNADNYDVAVESDLSNHSYVHNVESLTSGDLDPTSSPPKVESRATSYSGPGSHGSYNFAEGFTGKGGISENSSLRDNGSSRTRKSD